MRARRYFQLSFLLPIVFPLLVMLFFSAGFQGWGAVVLILWGSLVLGGIPYVLFAAGLLFWMRDKDYRSIQRMTLIAPLLFVPVFIYCVLAIVPLQILTTGEIRVESRGVFSICVFILILGYFYVLVTNAGFYLLKFLGYVVEEAEWERVSPSARLRLGRKQYLLAFIIALPILLIPVSMLIVHRARLNYPKRIADANRISIPTSREEALLEIVYDQARAERYEDAKATVASYVEDKDRGFGGIVSAQVSHGRYEDAKATVGLMTGLDSRVMALKQIAVAQAEGGDKQGARQTLSTALDEVQKTEDGSRKRFTLLTIVAGQAEAGLDDDLDFTLRLVEPSEILNTYRVVALIQAEKGRLKEAQGNFGKAIERAQMIKDPMSRASNLDHLSEAQADAGLLDDARATAEMITIKGYKEAALYHLSLVEKNPARR